VGDRLREAPAAVPDLSRAVLRTLAYADVFDYPLTPSEVLRYLIARPASSDDVGRALADPLVAGRVASLDGFVHLAGRADIVALRRRRARVAAAVWPRARRYGRWLSRLPFVRMVAVTGALAVDNVEGRPDIDFLIVTETGRLWSARAQTIVVVRLVAPFGDVICPNYLLSDTALTLEDRDLFTAHELAQMVPLSGLDVYDRLRAENGWTRAYLPNASGPPASPPAATTSRGGALQAAAERVGRSSAGERFEQWEMRRKIRKLSDASRGALEVRFTADVCKGHVSGHAGRILALFEERLGALDLR
jgi:hypothetical protein